MRFHRYSAVLTILVLAAFSGCGGGNGSGSSGGGGGGGGTPPPFQARPFPGDFFALPPETEFGLKLQEFPANVVYDSKLKEFFFSNNALNEVEAALNDHLACIDNAIDDDRAEAEESGEAERQRRSWYPRYEAV